MTTQINEQDLRQCAQCRALHDPDLKTEWLQNEKLCDQHPEVVDKIIRGMITEIRYCPHCAEELNADTEFPSGHDYDDEPDEGSTHGPDS